MSDGGRAAPTNSGGGRAAAAVAAVAGPAVIVIAVLLVLTEYLGGAVPGGGDIPHLWTPSFCHLGESLRAGNIPMWDPYILGGAPLAADPQPFGWLYLLPMAAFTALPCGPAMTLVALAQPIIAGLACYWFVRVEGASRAAATAGGLVLAIAIGASELLRSLPISAAVALGMLLLASFAWLLQATSPSSRILRALVVGLVVSQIVAAHMSVGVAMAAPLVGLYALAKAVPDIRRDRTRLRSWAVLLLGAAAVSALVSFA